ncbi:MAG TPA: hypothetical protein VME68_04900 [Acidobacteriaceae bacterium]|nr:hypothetical protein [Acidobacteriaceae bacterium]
MQSRVDTAWERSGWAAENEPHLELFRWTFAYLPDARMKSVAAEWMARVILGADPAEMNEEELQIVAVSSLMALRHAGEPGLHWDA